MASIVLVPAIGVLGVLVGSFLNVVVYRVPRGLSVVHPPSSCPGCGQRIHPRDNVPVLSWLLLGGRCRNCGMRISARYPLLELGTGAFFAIVAIAFVPPLLEASTGPGAFASAIALVAFLYLAAVTVGLAVIDLDTHTLPNRIVLPAYVVGGLLLVASAVLAADYEALLRAVIGLATLGGGYLLLATLYAGGMGFGDVKLAGVLGMFLGFLGWGELLVGAFGAFVLGGVFAVILVVGKRANRKSGIPFGPWMLAGAWAGILFGDALWRGYLTLVGLG